MSEKKDPIKQTTVKSEDGLFITTTTVETVTSVVKVMNPKLLVVGTKFKAKIKGVIVEGRINIPKEVPTDIYFCQDLVSGSNSELLSEYLYSWYIDANRDLSENAELQVLELTADPDYEPAVAKNTLEVGDYQAQYSKRHLKVGCQRIPFEVVEQVYKGMSELRESE